MWYLLHKPLLSRGCRELLGLGKGLVRWEGPGAMPLQVRQVEVYTPHPHPQLSRAHLLRLQVLLAIVHWPFYCQLGRTARQGGMGEPGQ